MSVLGAAGPIVLPPVNAVAILPETILVGAALVLLLALALVGRRLPAWVGTGLSLAASAAAFGSAWWLWTSVRHGGAYVALSGAVVVDGFSAFVLLAASGGLLLATLVAHDWLARERVGGVEFHVLAMLAVSGAMLMAAANDLIVVFLGLEIMSIPLYVLAGIDHRRAQSGEAAIKYFVLGAFSSALFVYGIALVYGATGSTNLAHIASYLASTVLVHDGVLLAGVALVLVGFGFKVAAAPFHTWTPDVYQGSPTPATGFMAAIAKLGGFAAFLRVLVSALPTLKADLFPAVFGLAALSLVVGSVLAVVQRDVKRMLAYSSVAHAGYVLVGLSAVSALGVAGSLYYLAAYVPMIVGSFAVVSVVGGYGDGDHDLEAYRGLASRRPLLALGFAVLLFAQAGAPFTTGFIAKLSVVAAVVAKGDYSLAILAVVSAVIAAFYYLRVVVLMYQPAAPSARFAVPVADALEGSSATPPAVPAEAAVVGALVGGTALREPEVLFPDPPDLPIAALGAGPPLDDGSGASEEPRGASSVPVTGGQPARLGWCTGAAIVLSLVFTVGFGLVPGPLVTLAHQARLFF